MFWTYFCILLILLAAELLYFRVAERFNIIDKPNQRSSHTRIVLRGGGIIFTIGLWVWAAFCLADSSLSLRMTEYAGNDVLMAGNDVLMASSGVYPWFLMAVTLAAGISFVDDIHSQPDSVRLVVQFLAMGLLLYQITIGHGDLLPAWWAWALFFVAGLIVCVGATNIYNFMDGINGITAGYSLAVLLPLLLVNRSFASLRMTTEAVGLTGGFVSESLIVVTILSVLVFSIFNFRPKNKAKCFAGDVGSVGIAFILLFLIGQLMMKSADITWLTFLIVYGVDGCCTIVHRIMLHENLGEAHRKHAYQLMANELGMSHVSVSLIYMGLQLAISLMMVYLVPDTALAHWIYLLAVGLVLVAAYVLFMKKYYHLHEEYLASLK